MKKINFSTMQKLLRNNCLWMLLALMSVSQMATAQCVLSVNEMTNLSLDMDCQGEVTPEMVGTTSQCVGGDFVIILEDEYGNILPSNIVDGDQVGQTLKVTLMDNISGNSSWGYLLVEDKLGPQIVCPAVLGPIFCYDVDTFEPMATDNCGDYEIIVTNISTVTNNCNDPSFSDEVLRRVTRSFIAVDASGRTSEECILEMDVLRVPSFDVITPAENYLAQAGNSLSCEGDYPRDDNGHPAPVSPALGGTGAPLFGGLPLFPSQDTLCNILVDYDDKVLPQIGCVTKIMRTWTILEWSCADAQRDTMLLQMIEISDDEAPTFACPGDILSSTNAHTCEASVLLPAVSPSDNCSDEFTYNISWNTGFMTTNGGLVQLPVGITEVTYVVYDECNRPSLPCVILVEVADHTPPVAICDLHTTVSLTNTGQAWVKAEVFDNESYDECSDVRVYTKRMNPDPCDCKVPTLKGYEYLGDRSGKYYYLSEWAYTYDHAKKEATALEVGLASLETRAEFDWVHEQVQETYDAAPYYIGLERNAGGVFQWANGTDLTYNSWGAGEPNNIGGVEAVAEVMPSGAWNDVPTSEMMRFVIELDDICGFADYVSFCCADVGNDELMIINRVIDDAGNHNDCMVEVQVQDKVAPKVHCPDDMVVDCDFSFDEDDLAAFFGTATSTGNCASEDIVERASIDLNQCNIGTITRTFTASNSAGADSCVQVIEFRPLEPFNYDGNDIVWPNDETITGCLDPLSDEFGTDQTGVPTFTEGACALVGANYEDSVFPFNNSIGDACFKIIREWTVIDWCQFTTDPQTGAQVYPRWYHTQIIKVNDPVDPTITSDCEAFTAFTYDAQCEEGTVTLGAAGTDECTNVLKYRYQVQENKNGSFFDLAGSQYSGHGSDNEFSVDIQIPVGDYRAIYTFEDRCGNIAVCEQPFSVVNRKTPTPYCLNGLAITLMPVDENGDGEPEGGMVELWASDFDAGSFHPCYDEVYLSFSEVTEVVNGEPVVQGNMEFTCETLGEQPVTIYAVVLTENDEILQDFCNTFVDVQDNMGVCDELETRAVISGSVVTPLDETLQEVTVELLGSEAADQTTDVIGAYAFPSMPYGAAYEVNPVKTDNPRNGVNTLDIVLIQRHILNMEMLDSPYKLIAADANNDNEIKASDLLALRKLVLGVHDDLPAGSWKFVDAAYEFADAQDPFSDDYPESYEINALESDMVIDFVAVKMGDVNQDASLKADTQVSGRSATTLSLGAQDAAYDMGETVRLPLTVQADASVVGAQFTFDINSDELEVIGIESEVITVDENNLGYTAEGMVTFSWNDINTIELATGETLATLVLAAKQSGSIASNVNITSDVTKAAAFGSDLETMNVDFAIENRDVDGKAFMVYQNKPNPFSELTTVTFDLPQAADVNFVIFDLTGKIVKTQTQAYTAGTHSIIIDKNDIAGSGLYYYQLEAGQYTATKKMVVIE